MFNIFNVLSEDFLEDLFPKQPSGNPTFSLHKEITSPKVTHEVHDSEGCNFLSEELPDIDSFNDIHPHFDDNPLSGSTTYSSNSLLEEFTDELALITYPSDYDDNLQFDIESDLREIEFLLYQGKDSNLKDSIDQTDHANFNDYFVDPTPEMFNDEHAPDYSFSSRFNVYADDFLEIKSDADNFYDDPFDSKGEKIKEDDDLPSPDYEDKVFNPGILIQEKSVTIITREKKLATSYASLVFEDFDPPFYEPLVFKDVPNSMMLLLFSSKNEEKVFKPRIYTSEKLIDLKQALHGRHPMLISLLGVRKTRKGQNRIKIEQKTGSVEKPGSVEDQSQSRKNEKEQNTSSRAKNANSYKLYSFKIKGVVRKLTCDSVTRHDSNDDSDQCNASIVDKVYLIKRDGNEREDVVEVYMVKVSATNRSKFSTRGLRKKSRLQGIVELDDEETVDDNNWKLGNYIAIASHLEWKIEEYPMALLFALYLHALTEDVDSHR
nr:hypothetical protein [Tanacetum cinerariifolium]